MRIPLAKLLPLCAFAIAGVLGPVGLAASNEPQQIIIAHRGASGYLPEHTLPAKALAHAMGADYLEQDVVLSKDNVPVVLHDVCIDTVTDVARCFPDRHRTNGRFYAIDFTLAELKQLQVTERFDPKTRRPVFSGRFPIWQASFQMSTLEEEIQFIQGLNKTTGRNVGIYPEVKEPAWHKSQGKDISPIVLKTLARFGYANKDDRCYLQCFEFVEVKRIRNELGYRGRLIQLLAEGSSTKPGTDDAYLTTPDGLAELAKVADGIGPSLQQVVTGKKDGVFQVTPLVHNAHAVGLKVHPYTIRADSLPRYATTADDLWRAFLTQAEVDGVFTDHPDLGSIFLRVKSRL